MTKKPCTNLEFLNRQAQKESELWGLIRKKLEAHEDFNILCPTLKRAKELIEQIRELVVEMNSKSKIKITRPFEKVSGWYKHKIKNDKTPH